MPTIVDYASLTASLPFYAHRANLSTDYLIQAAQEQVERDIPDLNFGNYIRFQEAPYTPVALSSGTTPVPSDWLGAKSLTVADGNGNLFPLVFAPLSWLYDAYPIRQPKAIPEFVARDSSSGTNVLVYGPYPDSNYTVQGTYYQSAPLLSASQTTNWMVTNAPTMLQAACMVQAGLQIPDDKVIARWMPIYQQKLKALVDADKAERWAAGTLVVQVA